LFVLQDGLDLLEASLKARSVERARTRLARKPARMATIAAAD